MGCFKGGGAMNWMDMSLQEFQDALASNEPTPGGGTAAAVALGQASALTQMVAHLTLGNEKWQDGWTAAQDAQHIVDTLYHRAGELAQLDSEAFDGVMVSFRMAKSTETEKNKRREAIRHNTLLAAKIPYETVLLGMELLSCHEALARNGNANAVSDIGVASLLASAAVKGALFNVEINLQSLPAEMGQEMRVQCPLLRLKCSEVSRGVMHAVHERMSD